VIIKFTYMMPLLQPENLDKIAGEAIDTEFHLDNINQEDGFSLNRLRKPLIHILKEQKKVLSKDKACTSSWLCLLFWEPW
jgi:hypothetical protein